MAEQEQVPLEPQDTGQHHEKYVVNGTKPSSYKLRKIHILLIALLVLLLIVIIIILAALLGVERAREGKDGRAGIPEKEGGGQATTGPPTRELWHDVRLPSTVAPLHYDLNMNIDPNKETFSGDVAILVNVTSSTLYLMLHSRDLNITKVDVQDWKAKESRMRVRKHFFYKPNQYHVTEMRVPIKPSLYKLTLQFTGVFGKGLFGLFRGSYKQGDGNTAYFAAMQFEPIDARSAFPCFDEPALKATYNVTVTHPKDMQAFSNMPVAKSMPKGDAQQSIFQQMVKTQTYLVAFAVGKYEFVEKTSPNGVKIRVIARPGRRDQMAFGLKMAIESLTQLENFFGIRYPLPKLDLIAHPECFVAMENWGLINFEEDGLLYKEEFSNEEVKQKLLIRWLPHEIAHMWFGNLVTMKWWNDIWLNEAYADYYNYHESMPASIKAWKMDTQFVHINVGTSLELDGYVNSRSVVEPTPVPNIGTFDDIVYKKGSSLIRMLIKYLGHDIFTKGIKKYLNGHLYGNTKTDDVWKSVQSVCPEKSIYIKNIMDKWVNKIGFPVVTVKQSSTPGKYEVTQQRFVYDKTAKEEQTNWYIPFTYISGANDATLSPSNNQTLWMKSNQSAEIKWNGTGWIKGNYEQAGFYRVNYPSLNWDNLAAQLEVRPAVFSEVDRYGLIDDSFNLARGNLLNITKALDVTKYLAKETDYLPWEGVKTNLGYIKKILRPGSHTYNHLNAYAAFQSKTLYNKLGFEHDGKHLDKMQRLMVVNFQCEAGVKSCLQNMTKRFSDWKSDPMSFSVTPAIRKLVYYYGVALGTDDDWDKVYKRVHTSIIASEMQPLLYGLAGSRNAWILEKYLQMSLDPTKIQKQYAKYVIDFVANENPKGASVAWSFVRSNWERIKKLSGGAQAAMLQYIPTVTKRFSTAYQLNQLTEFINENLNGQPMPRHLGKAIEVVKVNIQWRAQHEKDLENWLRSYLAKKNVPSSEKDLGGFTDPA